jgi:hypothetical protein
MGMREHFLSLFMVIGMGFSMQANVQKLEFDVILMNNKIGSTSVEKHVKSDSTQYYLKSNSTAKVLMVKQSSSISFDVLYKKGQMIYSQYKSTKSDESINTKVFWDKTKYMISYNGISKTSPPSISMSTIQLYFQEPKNVAKIFVERLGEYINIIKKAESTYAYTLPDGVTTTYKYVAGKINEIEMSKGMGSVYMKLVK